MDEEIPWASQEEESTKSGPDVRSGAGEPPSQPGSTSNAEPPGHPPELPQFDPNKWAPPSSQDTPSSVTGERTTGSSAAEKDRIPIAEPEPEGFADELSPLGFMPLPRTTKIGVLGGTNFGKTYLFQAMVYRLLEGETSGALSYYLADSDLWEFPFSARTGKRGPGVHLLQTKFIQNYKRWIPLKNTEMTAQKWYCLRLQLRSGLIGTSRSAMDVEFLDGWGEGFEQPLTEVTLPTWRTAFQDAAIMIFCLPIWAVFPRNLTKGDEEDRERFLVGFDTVLSNYLQVKRPGLRVRTILALTMADDRRCSLRLMKNRWIEPFENHPDHYLDQMRRGSGASRYLASGRAISDHIHRIFKRVGDAEVRRIPQRLNLGRGRPYLVPVTALDGAILDGRKRDKDKPPPARPPVPIHVELPLLVALCERYNILM